MIKKWRLVFIVVVALVTAVGIAIATKDSKWSIFSSREASIMTDYLEKKYSQEFVVENISTQGAGLGVRGSWTGEAYPKSDPSLRFRIDRSQTTGKISVDTFLQTLWTREGTEEVKAFLDSKLPQHEGYYLNIDPGNPGNLLYDSIQGETPSLDNILRYNSDKVLYSLSVRNVVATAPKEPSAEQLEGVFELVNFVKKKGIKISYVRYGYRDTSFKLKNRVGEQQYQYTIHVKRDELSGINTPADLAKYFETYE